MAEIPQNWYKCGDWYLKSKRGVDVLTAISTLCFQTHTVEKITRMSSASSNNRVAYVRLTLLQIINLKSGQNIKKKIVEGSGEQ